MRRALLASVAALLAAAATTTDARASGLYFTDRGVRPMGRAGAFVAGADDLGGRWYNPAGLADAGTSFLFDASWLQFSVDYTRVLRVVNAARVTYPGEHPTITEARRRPPLPTVAASYVLDSQGKFTIAGGVFAPYIALASYPTTVQSPTGPAPPPRATRSPPSTGRCWPSRRVDGLQAHRGAAVRPRHDGAARLVPGGRHLQRVPAGPPALRAGAARVRRGGADARGAHFAPSLTGGVTWVPEEFRFGASGQLPMVVNSEATFKVRMASAAEFDGDGERRLRPTCASCSRRSCAPASRCARRTPCASRRRGSTSSGPRTRTSPPSRGSPSRRHGLAAQARCPAHRHPPRLSGLRLVPPRRRAALPGRRVLPRRPRRRRLRTSAVPPPYLSLSSLDFPKWILSMGGTLRRSTLALRRSARARLRQGHLRRPEHRADPADQPAPGWGASRISSTAGTTRPARTSSAWV